MEEGASALHRLDPLRRLDQLELDRVDDAGLGLRIHLVTASLTYQHLATLGTASVLAAGNGGESRGRCQRFQTFRAADGAQR